MWISIQKQSQDWRSNLGSEFLQQSIKLQGPGGIDEHWQIVGQEQQLDKIQFWKHCWLNFGLQLSPKSISLLKHICCTVVFWSGLVQDQKDRPFLVIQFLAAMPAINKSLILIFVTEPVEQHLSELHSLLEVFGLDLIIEIVLIMKQNIKFFWVVITCLLKWVWHNW